MIDSHLALGVSVSHDRAAVLIADGMVVAGIAQERLDRKKHSIVQAPDGCLLKTLPVEAMNYCLEVGGVKLSDLDDLVVVGSVVYHPTKGIRNPTLEDIAEQLPEFPKERITLLNHHLAHAASVYLPSPFSSAAVLVIDGAGNIQNGRKKTPFSIPDVEHTTAYHAKGDALTEIFKVSADKKAMNSLGALYSLVSRFIGFGEFEEGKTMGLAPFGNLGLVPLFEKAVEVEDLGYWIAPDFQPFDTSGRLFNQAFLHHFGPPRNHAEPLRSQDKDMARAVQEVLEKTLEEIAFGLRQRTGEKNLCISGGVGLNCVANGCIAEKAGFENVFVTPAPADDGTALGAALWAWGGKRGGDKRYFQHHAFLGKNYTDSEIVKAINAAALSIDARKSGDVSYETARLLANGDLVGWFQGGSEFGPRALGHRSILCDPRSAQLRDRLNNEIKHREPFRPFAPAVIESRVNEYFELAAPSPFMSFTGRVKNPNLLAGVCHVDGSARVQTVPNSPEQKRFFELLRAFETECGLPVLLNTSFNVAGEPIVESPGDAIACFLDTRLDALVLGDYIITKKNKELSGKIADLKHQLRDQQRKISGYENELASIRSSRGWRLIRWLNRTFRPWTAHPKRQISIFG